MKHENPPAFPSVDNWTKESLEGMTLRDYFAAKAMQGWLSNPSAWEPTHGDKNAETFQKFAEASAVAAFIFADAMLEARNK